MSLSGQTMELIVSLPVQNLGVCVYKFLNGQ
jgi:hypothetical protein